MCIIYWLYLVPKTLKKPTINAFFLPCICLHCKIGKCVKGHRSEKKYSIKLKAEVIRIKVQEISRIFKSKILYLRTLNNETVQSHALLSTGNFSLL